MQFSPDRYSHLASLCHSWKQNVLKAIGNQDCAHDSRRSEVTLTKYYVKQIKHPISEVPRIKSSVGVGVRSSLNYEAFIAWQYTGLNVILIMTLVFNELLTGETTWPPWWTYNYADGCISVYQLLKIKLNDVAIKYFILSITKITLWLY